MKKLLTILCALCLSVSAFAQLPSVTLKDIDGKTVNTAELYLSNDGKPIIIDFFATWCKPCLRELDAINEVYAEWQEETGVKVIAVSTDQAQNVNKVKPLVNNKGWEYEVLLDVTGDFKRGLGINMITHTIIIEGKGNIDYQHSGNSDGAEDELIEKVRQLVAE